MSVTHPSDPGFPSGASWHESDTTFDDVVLVDRNDVATGTMPKLRAHYLGHRHRALSVLICDCRDRLLLQRRASGKYHSAGLWTNTCCSHPRPGEQVVDAAARRLKDEMGIGCALTPLFRVRYRLRVSEQMLEHEITHVFGGRFDGEPSPNPREVEEWLWMPLEQVAYEVDRHPDRFTPWFRRFRRLHWTKVNAFATAGIGAAPPRQMAQH